MDNPQSSYYVTSQWILTKLTLPSFWPLWLYFSVPLANFPLLLEMTELLRCSLRSSYFLILHSLPKSTHPLSWPHFYAESSPVCTTAQTFLQSPEPLNYLLYISAYIPQAHLFRTKLMVFPTILQILHFPFQIHSLPRRLTWLTIVTDSLASGFHLDLATGDPWQETGNKAESEWVQGVYSLSSLSVRLAQAVWVPWLKVSTSLNGAFSIWPSSSSPGQ